MEVIKIGDYIPKGYIKADRDFKDMMISALRYAIPRHTYMVDMTCEYIKEHADVILDDRVVAVMLRDLTDYLEKQVGNPVPSTWACDYETLADLRRFLEDYDVEKSA